MQDEGGDRQVLGHARVLHAARWECGAGRKVPSSTQPMRISPSASSRVAAPGLLQRASSTPCRRRAAATVTSSRSSSRAGPGSARAVSVTTNMRAGAFAQLLLAEAQRAQPLGARALEELQVVGVEDHAAGVGVFPVDAHRVARTRQAGRGGGHGHYVISAGMIPAAPGGSLRRDLAYTGPHSGWPASARLSAKAGSAARAARNASSHSPAFAGAVMKASSLYALAWSRGAAPARRPGPCAARLRLAHTGRRRRRGCLRTARARPGAPSVRPGPPGPVAARAARRRSPPARDSPTQAMTVASATVIMSRSGGARSPACRR